MRYIDRLFDQSPYSGFDVSRVPADLQGWGADHPVFEQIFRELRPSLVIEVGSWKGSSAITMARIMRDLNIAGEIICVDTWLGSVEHWLKQGVGWYESLRIAHGRPRLYDTFMANVIRAGFTDIITPLPNTSENAAKILAAMDCKCDLCYIDAAHEHDAVLNDLRAYWPLVTDGGVLFGDDYMAWEGVTSAAEGFAREIGSRLFGAPGKFVLRKEARPSAFGLPQRV